MTILWVTLTCKREAEASSVEHFVMMWSAVSVASFLRYFCVKSFHVLWRDDLGKALDGYGPQFDLGPARFPRQSLRGAYAKVRTDFFFENLALSFSEKAVAALISPFFQLNIFWIIQSSLHAKSLQPTKKNKIPRSERNNLYNIILRCPTQPLLRYMPTQDLRTKHNSLRMNNVSSSSIKLHHLEKKRCSTPPNRNG